MNRAERRAKHKKDKTKPVTMFGLPESTGLKNGDVFTIAGYKKLKNGNLIKDCKPGEETMFTAEIESFK